MRKPKTLKDLLRVRPKEEWRGESVEARLAFIENAIYVLYPALVRAYNEIERQIRRSRVSKKGRALLIIWDSGGGKSHFIRLLCKVMPTEETIAATRVKIVSFSIPGKPTQDNLTRAVLHAVGDPAWNTRPADIERAIDLMQDIGVLAVAIDNVQDIPEHRGTIGTRLASNWIRDLIENGRLLVILLGTSAAEEVVRSNPQLRRRVPPTIKIPYFGIEPEDKLKRLKRFLSEVDLLLPLAEICDLHNYAKQIYWATFGIADYIFKLLAEAVEIAVVAGRERLIQADLEGAFNLVFQDAGLQLNPFVSGGPTRVLDRSGEPFEKWNENASVNRAKRKT